MKLVNWFQVGVIATAAVVWAVLAIDSWQMDQVEKVVPRDGITPALLDLAKREHRARAEWCRMWVDSSEKRTACLQEALITYQEAVE
jgi:hypothetical protein